MSHGISSGWVALAACLLVTSSCASKKEPNALSGDGAAADECNALVSKLCSKSAPCQNQSQQECIDGENAYLEQKYGDGCSGADQVKSVYDKCMTDLDQYTCGDPLPANCVEVVIFYQYE